MGENMGENFETMAKQEHGSFMTNDDDVYIDFDFLWGGENVSGPIPDSPQVCFADLPDMNYAEGREVGISQGAEVPRSSVVSPSYNSELSDCRVSDGFSESTENSTGPDEKLEHSLELFTDHGYSNNVTGLVPDQGSTSFMQSDVWCQNGSETAPFDALNHNGGGFSFHGGNDANHNAATSEFYYPNYEDRAANDVSSNEFSSYDVDGAEIQDLLSENDDQHTLNSHNLPFSPRSPGFPSFTSDYHWMGDIMGDRKIHNEGIKVISYDHHVGNVVGHHNNLSYGFGNLQNQIEIKRNDGFITSNDIVSRASGVIDGVMSRNSSSLISNKNFISRIKDETEGTFLESSGTFHSIGTVGDVPIKASSIHDQKSVIGLLSPPSVKSETNSVKMEIDVPKFNDFCHSNITYQGIPSNTFAQSYIDDDPDVQILEELRQPAHADSTMRNANLVQASHFSSSKVSVGPMVTSHSRIKPNDERVIYRVALQDLSQPKSEATPPEGLLAVPLLKHQRIALYWMVNKETKGACCSGGILADDQGLGKTVSTISLILKERSPSSKATKAIEQQLKTETLNLDEDDDDVSEIYDAGERANDFHIDGGSDCSQTKGRPAAGTLIVCPTSVLRQWSEELHSKVTSKANLSILVYHGSNRTKDPLELAKYDVVVTTYAIVSQEVPKQPNVNEVDDSYGTPFMSSNKRKLLGNVSDKKPYKKKKSKNGDNDDLIDKSGPLAKVGWFRVVLDEAQSIKNHRTQAARACWGLRAKRRWCLSGTPIQNSIDDLYSYFRFLRHEPYAVFKTFCEQLKVPIQRNPKNGYKKLQAVLKTIMLRRTKGTRLDGEPIINLPPKTIELKQVDFSKDELDFYRTLEADSRAQFAEYAANGTVEQNYVNILLMLLRLRQACDHPLLVKQSSSHSKIASSIAMAKKLPPNKQAFLLNCLEASLAICGICSDPPEDAVVAVCGHVFCNQCILEHMLGDDPHCPAKNCKTRFSMSCVFSVMSLRSALSDNLASGCTTQSNGSELVKVSNPNMSSYPQDSSKIKAALQILLSLAKPSDCVSNARSSEELQICYLGGENSTKDENKNAKGEVKVAGEKAIVFSQWTKMLDLLEACLKNTSIQYRRLDGTMPITARDRAVKDFNSLPQVTVMIMSLKAASLGLNMVAACHVVLLDLWWNPTTEDQAIDRAHRIGQTRPVSVFRLTVKDTVEDRILALQQRKRQMVASAFGEDETGSQQTRLTVNDLKYLFRVD